MAASLIRRLHSHAGTGPQRARACGKVLLCITEDWFCLSHFQPLLRTLVSIADEVVVATHGSGRMGEIEALGFVSVSA